MALLLFSVLLLTALAHTCIHDELQSKISVERITFGASGAHGHVNPTMAQPLRIALVLDNLFDESKFCTSPGQSRPAFTSNGARIVCTAEGVLTSEKRNVLLSVVLPSMKDFFSRALSVTRTTEAIRLPSQTCFTDIKIPTSATTDGISDADYVIIVTAGQTSGSTIAFAAYCGVDDAERPIVGFINYGSNFLNVDTQSMLRVAVHEMMHALGFSSSYFTSSFPTGSFATETRRGQEVRVVTAPAVVTAAREYFACPTLTGPELENEGSAGTSGSHWKRRSQLDDVMAGIIDGALVSLMTLALFQASGRYTVNYSVVESPRWGRGAGCGFFASRCDTVEGRQGHEFCLGGNYLCTSDRRGYGPCGITTYSSALPPSEQYFSNPAVGGSASLMSFCPIVTAYANARCTDVINRENNTLLAEAFTASSRCIVTSDGFVRTGQTLTSALPRRCMPVRCVGSAVSVWVGSQWVDCPSEGAVISGTAYGYSGTFTCPVAAEVCDTPRPLSIVVAGIPLTFTASAAAGVGAWAVRMTGAFALGMILIL